MVSGGVREASAIESLGDVDHTRDLGAYLSSQVEAVEVVHSQGVKLMGFSAKVLADSVSPFFIYEDNFSALNHG